MMIGMNFAEYYGIGIGNGNGNWVNDVHNEVVIDLFENQDEVVEVGRGRYPVLKEGAYDFIYEKVVEAAGPLLDDIVYGILDSLYRGIIDAGPYKEMLEDWFEQEYIDWEEMYPAGVPLEEYMGETGTVAGRKI